MEKFPVFPADIAQKTPIIDRVRKIHANPDSPDIPKLESLNLPPVLGYLLGMQRVRLALVAQVFINAVNIGAVLLYVYGFGWGIAGIGAATATADACGFALGAWMLWRLRPRPGAHNLPPATGFARHV